MDEAGGRRRVLVTIRLTVEVDADVANENVWAVADAMLDNGVFQDALRDSLDDEFSCDAKSRRSTVEVADAESAGISTCGRCGDEYEGDDCYCQSVEVAS